MVVSGVVTVSNRSLTFSTVFLKIVFNLADEFLKHTNNSLIRLSSCGDERHAGGGRNSLIFCDFLLAERPRNCCHSCN